MWEKAQERAEAEGVSLRRSDYADPMGWGAESLRDDPLFRDVMFEAEADEFGDWYKLFAESSQRSPGAARVRRPKKPTLQPYRRLSPKDGLTINYQAFFQAEMSEEEARLAFVEKVKDHEERLTSLAEVILEAKDDHIFAQEVIGGIPFNLEGIFGIVGAFESSAIMAVRSGNSARALRMVRVLDRLGRLVDGPSVMTGMIGSGVFVMETTVIWEGLRVGIWSREELATLQELLMERDWLATYVESVKFEIADGVESIDGLAAGFDREGYPNLSVFGEWLAFEGPQGWVGKRKAFLTNLYLDLIEMLEKQEVRRFPELQDRCRDQKWSPNQVIAQGPEVVIRHITRRFVETETLRRIAMIAVALEDWKLAGGTYPVSLEETRVTFPLVDLSDPEQRMLGYKLGRDGRPIIWSKHEAETSEREVRLRWQFWAEGK